MNAAQNFKIVLKNFYYFCVGLVLIMLNKIRHQVEGYKTPRPFPITEINRSVEYDFGVVDHWIKFGKEYTGPSFSLNGRTILELGPGADLGIGLITLMNGARKYSAMDVHDLIRSVPAVFYEELFRRIDRIKEKEVSVDFLRAQLESARVGAGSRLNYLCTKSFDLSTLEGEGVDLVLSNSAFEHFDDVERTISQLSSITKKGALFIAEIDFKTHTRWIKDVDPLNIYRYPRPLYDLFKFRGSPNRLRPFEYKEILERHGWSDIRMSSLEMVAEKPLSEVNGFLAKRFRDAKNEMRYLNVMLGAVKL